MHSCVSLPVIPQQSRDPLLPDGVQLYENPLSYPRKKAVFSFAVNSPSFFFFLFSRYVELKSSLITFLFGKPLNVPFSYVKAEQVFSPEMKLL